MNAHSEMKSRIMTRLSCKRKLTDQHLSIFTYEMAHFWSFDKTTRNVLDQFVHRIIDECEPYEGMPLFKMKDAWRELSHLSIIYTDRSTENASRVHDQIKVVKSKYKSFY